MDLRARNSIEQVKRAVIKKYPIFGVTLFNVPIEENKRISTAGVVGEKIDGEIKLKGIEYNPDFFDSLSFDDRVFVLAHEASHIAFKHFIRGKDKQYQQIWNIATDACINAFLKNDGLNMPSGVIDPKTGQPMEFVDIADGLYRSAEAIYDKLVKKEEDKKKQQENSQSSDGQQGEQEQSQEQSQSQQSEGQGEGQGQEEGEQSEPQEENIGGGLDDIDIDNYQGIDSHESWEGEQREDAEQDEQSKKQPQKSLKDKIKDMLGGADKEDKESDKKPKDKNLDDAVDETFETKPKEPEDSIIDESEMFRENAEEREKQQKEALKRAFSNITEQAGCTHIKNEKPVLSWKQLLVRSVEEESERWGYRRASRTQPNMRIEDVTRDDRATTEVILDTSGSISDQLLRGFLRQLVPLFKETDIKVGCFSGRFYDFTELKTTKQIEEFKAKRDSNGTNFEAAATAFSKGNGTRINKIVFTDGELDSLSSHVQRTKVDGIMWIVFGNKMNFTPLGGKIIRVNDRDFKQMLNLEQDMDR